MWGFKVNPNCLVHKMKKLFSKFKIIEWNVDEGNVLQKCSFVVCTYLFHLHIFRKKRIKEFYMMEKMSISGAIFITTMLFLCLVHLFSFLCTVVQLYNGSKRISTNYKYSTGLISQQQTCAVIG